MHVGDPVLDVFFTLWLESQAAVKVGEMGLGADADIRVRPLLTIEIDSPLYQFSAQASKLTVIGQIR